MVEYKNFILEDPVFSIHTIILYYVAMLPRMCVLWALFIHYCSHNDSGEEGDNLADASGLNSCNLILMILAPIG